MPKNLKIILIAMWVIVGLSVGGVAAGVWWYRNSQHVSAAQLNSMGTDVHHLDPMFDAPPFALIDQDGKPFNSSQLKGKVWVADFVFTSCTSLCPMMTEQMHEFQTKPVNPAVQMVSFSVDPDNDTPAALKTYAETNKADLSRWHFLTGDKKALWDMSNGMKLAVETGENHQVMHSSHFLLVDANGHVRGIYDYKDAGYLDRLVADVNAVVAGK